MNDKVTKIALASRLILFCLQILSNVLIPDHQADAFRSPSATPTPGTVNENNFADKFFNLFFGGFRRWDAEYFLHIAEYGYTYEHTLAFYPLYPGILNLLARGFNYVLAYPSYRCVLLVIGVLINAYFFHRAANCLYDLTQKIFKDSNKSWNTIVLFCFNPASVFFSAPYSEGLFCWLTFSLMLECSSRQISFFKTATALSLSIICRSNGLINLGYPIYFVMRSVLTRKNYGQILKLVCILLISLVPLTIYNFYAFQKFCNNSSTGLGSIQIQNSPIEILQQAKEKNYILAGVGRRKPEVSGWCEKSFPFPYSYIQSHYWNVGFMKYYEIKQIPNFLLALPILSFMFYQSFRYFYKITGFYRRAGFISTISEWKCLPFVLHSLILTIVCTFFVHVQIATRLIASSSPCLYWFAVDLLPSTFQQIELKSIRSSILYWFGSYFIVGTILFSNFLPWT